MKPSTFWIMKKTGHGKFPYRLTVVKGSEVLLDLFVQDRWPGVKGNIFCIQAEGRDGISRREEEIERVPVLNYSLFGKRLTIILDRAREKRCSFLFLTRSYKQKEGEYEQIFWQTPAGLAGHRTKYKLAYSRDRGLKIFMDSSERYAWTFPGAVIVKEKLPIGDYAIKDDHGFLAVVERKTFPNLMGEFGNLKKFHQHLSELETCRNSALVVEAAYGDFLDKDKIFPYTGSFGAKALAEIQAAHPGLAIIFSGSRKAAAIWALHFFQAVQAKQGDVSSSLIRDGAAKYGRAKNATYAEDEARRLVLTVMPREFTSRQFRDNLPDLTVPQTQRILKKMQNEGIIKSEKRGRDLVWIKDIIYD